MYLFAKFGIVTGPYGNGNTNSYISSYMNTLEKAELNISLHHSERFSKSGIPIYNSEVLDIAGRKIRIFEVGHIRHSIKHYKLCFLLSAHQ